MYETHATLEDTDILHHDTTSLSVTAEKQISVISPSDTWRLKQYIEQNRSFMYDDFHLHENKWLYKIKGVKPI